MALKPVTTPDIEAATVELSIDGRTVTAKDGVSLYDVISNTGKIVPAMCYHYTFDPFGSCGMCLVTVEGKKAPVRSCTAKAAAGMVVRTDGDDLFQARKKAVEKHLSVHPLDCPVCDADGHCELQDMAFQHQVTNLANAKQKLIPEDTRRPVLDFNMNRCIACGECINVCKDVLMIDTLQFIKKGGFTQVVAKGDTALACEFCGDCLAVCPVGAITNKYSKYLYKPWQLRKTTTTCNYCGDGCQMHLETKDNEVVRATFPRGVQRARGARRVRNEPEAITKAKAHLLAGTNITGTTPLRSVAVKEGIRVCKAQVILVGSAQTNIPKLAAYPTVVRPGTG